MATIDRYNVKITVATAIAVIIFVILTSVHYATWKAKMEAEIDSIDARQDHLVEKYSITTERVDELEDKSSERDVDIALINTKLATIETLLLEIRQEVKTNH